jgi:hypothetical protein
MGRAMKHVLSRELFASWDKSRGENMAPAEFDSGALPAAALPHIFLLDRAPCPAFRLAGGGVCAMFRRELRGTAFLTLWHNISREEVFQLIAALEEDTVGVVANVLGEARGQDLPLELMLLPILDGGSTRFVGSLVPLHQPYWLGEIALEPLVLAGTRHLGPNVDRVAAPVLRAPPNSRLRRGFVVYDGGVTRPEKG